MSQYEQGQWDMFVAITSAEYGKQCYFLDDNGFVYSRRTCKTLSVEDAYKEFFDWIESEWASI